MECKDYLCNEWLDKADLILIETYWNVKASNLSAEMKSASDINRDILECKVGETTLPYFLYMILIETYWNVKEEVLPIWIFFIILIETYWNVKQRQESTTV